MAMLIGGLMAVGTAMFAAMVGLDRARAFYPMTIIMIASYYILFALMGGGAALLPEVLLFAAFAAAAVWGFKRNLWIAVVALLVHAMVDAIHGQLVSNPGVPAWWPAFCLAYDVFAAGCLALLILPGARRDIAAELEVAAAAEAAGRARTAFERLERAHVMAQSSTLEHVRVHWRMLLWSLRQRDRQEAFGQALRIVGAAVGTPLGLVPVGNSGGSRVSALRRMEIPADLASAMAEAPRWNARSAVAATLQAGATYGRRSEPLNPSAAAKAHA